MKGIFRTDPSSSSCISLFNTSTWSGGIIVQVLQFLCSSLASLAIFGQKPPSLCNLLYRPTLRFTPHISWCNLCNCVSLSCLETYLISNPYAPLKNRFPLILRKSFIFDGRFNPISLPWTIAFNKGSHQSSGRHNSPLTRPGCFSTLKVIFSFFNINLVARVASELANLFSFWLITLHSMDVKCFI